MIFDDVRANEPPINEYFCRGRHNKCNMIHLNQNLFTRNRQSIRENRYLFILFEQRAMTKSKSMTMTKSVSTTKSKSKSISIYI